MIVENVSAEEGRFQAVPVLEKVVAELQVLRAQIRPVEVVRRCSSGDESADVLPKAAAEVEEGLRGLETRDEGLEEGVLDYREVEEAQSAYTGIWVDGPGALALELGESG